MLLPREVHNRIAAQVYDDAEPRSKADLESSMSLAAQFIEDARNSPTVDEADTSLRLALRFLGVRAPTQPERRA